MSACGAPWASSPLLSDETRIRSNDDVDAIIAVVEAYADALESMSVDAVLPMISSEYYENSGTTDTTTDDYGFEGVFAMLETLSSHVREMRVELEIKDIVVDGDRAEVLCDFGLTMLYEVGDAQRWQTERDVNRLQFQREETGWLIVSGL
jgi:hypothetical protein